LTPFSTVPLIRKYRYSVFGTTTIYVDDLLRTVIRIYAHKAPGEW